MQAPPDSSRYGARWYKPTTGTWTQEDTLNAPLNPANGTDPTGLDAIDAAITATGLSATSAAAATRASAIRRVTAEVGLFCRSLTATRSRAAWTPAGDTRTCLRLTGSSSTVGYVPILGHEVNLVDGVGVQDPEQDRA